LVAGVPGAEGLEGAPDSPRDGRSHVQEAHLPAFRSLLAQQALRAED